MEDLANLQAYLTNLMLFGFGSLMAAIGALGALGWFLYSSLKKDMKDMEARLNKRMDDMEENHKNDLDEMESRQTDRMNEMETRQTDRMNEMESRQNKRMDKLESSLTKLSQDVSGVSNDVSWVKGVLYEKDKFPGQVPYELMPDRASQQQAAEISEPAPEGDN